MKCIKSKLFVILKTKTYKKYYFILIGLIIFTTSSLPIFASNVNMMMDLTLEETFEMEEDFMKEFEDVGNCVDVKVKIYNHDYQLVRCGSEKNAAILDLLDRADFLTTAGGIEFYRLNK